MRTLLSGLNRFAELLMLIILLMIGGGMGEAIAQGFTNPGGGDGGFTGRPLITVELYVNDTVTGESVTSTRVPVNLAGVPVNPSLPYTRTLTALLKQDGRLLAGNIQLDLAPTLASGALFNPEDLTQGFRSLPLTSSGISTAFFQASSTPGTVIITASAQDPTTQQVVSASIEIEVYNEERPPFAITFTGPYVNAVLAGQTRFGDPSIQSGTYSRVVSVVVNDINGNPTNPNTQINFFLVDGPLTGYPDNPGSFFMAGPNGDPAEGQLQFKARRGAFRTKGVLLFDSLVLDGRFLDTTGFNNSYHTTLRRVQSVPRQQVLNVSQPFNSGKNNRGTVPYIIGRAMHGAVLSPSFTDLNGVASTTLTYPVENLGQTAVLMACTTDMDVCGILNTCNPSGANCGSVYLAATSGADRVLTVSATSLGPNRSTDVRMCLRDVNFSPLPATEIRYDVGARGQAAVTINDVADVRGAVLTGAQGCTTVTIASGGQIPGSQEIPIEFTSDNVAAPVTVTIRSPGAGKLDGLFDCQFTPEEGTGACSGTLRLTDDEGSPMAGVLIGVGNIEAAGRFSLSFDPADGELGRTNDQGQVQVGVSMERPGAYSFPFQTQPGATATYTLTVNVPAPGLLQIALDPTAAEVGSPYSGALTATGGVPPYEWSIAGALPPGLSLNGSTGIISGTPTTDGTFSFVVNVKEDRPAGDNSALTGTAAFTIVVGKQPELTVALEPAAGAVGVPFNGVASATGGAEPYTFSLLAGSLPSGLSLASSGTVSGTPTAIGTFAVSIKATDSKGATGTGNFSIAIASESPITVALEGEATGTIGASFSSLLTATGGASPYTFRRVSGNVPTGLTLNADGSFTGTPSTAGAFTFTVEAKDKNGLPGTGTITITINATDAPVISTASPLPDAPLNSFYSVVFEATGGTKPYAWTLEGGTLPPGLSLNASTGVLSGTPTGLASDFSFIIRVTERDGAFGLKSFTLPVGGGSGGVSVASIELLSSSPQLESSGKTPVTLTAIAKDANNNVVPGATITFTADSNASIQTVDGGVTGDNGAATAMLSTTGDRSNRTITLTASSGGVTDTITIQVVGTKITISGPTTAVVGSSVSLILTLADSANTPIPGIQLTVSAAPSNPLDPAAPVTGNDGRVNVTLTANAVDADNQIVVTANGAGATGSLTISVSQDNFIFVTPLSAPAEVVNGVPNIPLNTPQTLRVRWLSGSSASPVVGQPVTFSATRGVLTGANPAMTDVNGEATIQIEANNAGASLITATTTADGPSASLQVLFVATEPAQMTLQAAPSVVGVNPDADNANEKSTITAVVRDDNDNLVANRTVNFTLTDSTGGTISPSSAVTDTFGRTTTVYTAGPAPSANNGVRVDAVVSGVSSIRCPGQQAVASGTGVPGQPQGPGPFANCSVSLTVAKKELFIRLGTGNQIEELSTTQFKQPWNVLLTDSAGGPVQNATVNLSILPTAYYKGYYVKPCDDCDWVQVITAGPCSNEDLNNNGILDPGEDTNGNGRLDPGNVAAPSVSSLPTDADGFGLFDVLYAQQYSNWVDVNLVAQTQVSGSEALAIESYILPILASKLKGDASPPGNPSPYGFAPSCDFSTEIGISPDTLDTAALGRSYVQLLVATGGTAPYSWSLVSGALPNGLNLSSGGVISGTPSVAGTFDFTVRVDDSGPDGAFNLRDYTLLVDTLITITPTTLPNAQAGVVYSQVLTAVGGTPPYTWTLEVGSLPNGLTLDSGGFISGTPTAQGASTFTVRTTDPTGAAGLQQYTLIVGAP